MKIFILAFLGLMIAFAFLHPVSGIDENVSKLIVQGEGEVSAVPDQVTILLGVQTRNAKATIAAEDNARLMNQTIESLLAAGLSMKNIQTSHYSLSLEKDDEPFEANKQSKPEKNPEFVVSNRLTIKMDRVNNLGEIIDAAIKAGSNDILSIDFGLNDPRNQTEEALALAIEDAERKAEVMASKAGVKLRKILEISEGYGYISARDGFAYEAAAPITPIQPGEMDVKASVTMTYEII